MRDAAPAAAALGVTIEEAASAVGTLGDAGVQAGIAGRTLRGIFVRLGNDIQAAGGFAEVLEGLRGISLDVAVDLVGQEFATRLLTLIDSVDRIRDLDEANQRAEGSAQRLADRISDDLTGSINRLRSAVVSLINAIGADTASGLRGFIDALTRTVNFLEENVDTFIDTISALATAITGILVFRGFTALLRPVAGVASAAAAGIGRFGAGISALAASIIGVLRVRSFGDSYFGRCPS